MSDTIKSVLNDGKLKSSSLTVKLVKQLGLNSYIIADKSMVAILSIEDVPNHSKYLNPGCWYKLIKCQKCDSSTLKLNKLFKPVKTLVKQDIGDISIDVEELENKTVVKASGKKYKDFKALASQPNHSKIDRITVKVITQSRIISTEKGNYQICNIKDVNGETTSINLYSKYVNQLTPFNIYTIMNLRKAEVTKNDETKMRLHTTGFTKIEDGDVQDSMNFQNLTNGDETITGVVIGFGEISLYQSCKLHYRKLDDDLKCPKCDNEISSADILEDFRTEVYIEASNDENKETDVKEIVVFKRALDIKLKENTEEQIEGKLDELTGHTMKVDYNVDDANRFIAVSIQMMK